MVVSKGGQGRTHTYIDLLTPKILFYDDIHTRIILHTTWHSYILSRGWEGEGYLHTFLSRTMGGDFGKSPLPSLIAV